MGINIMALRMGFLIAIFVFLHVNKMQAGGGKAMSFGKSRARLISESQNKVTFQDVAGVEEAKEELGEIIEFLRDPKKFTRLGGKIPKGVLLMGAPGTGKTLLAKAVAGEASVPFFSISGSDFVEMFVGVGSFPCPGLFSRRRKMLRVLFSLMRSTPWVVIEGLVWVAAMTNANRRSTNSWSKWTALKPTRA